MEDLNVNVLRGFNIKAVKVLKSKSSYIVNTGNSYKTIKKVFVNPEDIIFQNEVKENLYKNGFQNIDRFYNSVQNKPYFSFENNIYIMSDFFDLPISDFSDNNHFKAIIENVSKMHKLLINNKIAKNSKLFYKSDIIGAYKKDLKEMGIIKKKISNTKRLSDFDVVFLKNYQFYLDEIKITIEILEKSQVQKFIDKSIKEKTICHNLLKEENILIKNDETYITNFSSCTYNYYLLDLSSIIRRYARHVNNDKLTILQIVEAYCKENGLYEEEIKILYGILRHPQKYIKICRQYYSKNRTWAPSTISTRIEEITNNKETYSEFINKLL